MQENGIQPPSSVVPGAKAVVRLGQPPGHAYRRLHRGILTDKAADTLLICVGKSSDRATCLRLVGTRAHAATIGAIRPRPRAPATDGRGRANPACCSAYRWSPVPAHRARTKREPVRPPRADAARGGGAVRDQGWWSGSSSHGAQVAGPHRCTGTRGARTGAAAGAANRGDRLRAAWPNLRRHGMRSTVCALIVAAGATRLRVAARFVQCGLPSVPAW